ncbi:MAG: Nif3-like dinuclear metal center hexameric protein [Verrucomicrobia bacterium]|nr:Nif3-like dinuclear metal center hexameric protein [Verrucomicrobiota bacterium]
MITLQALFQFLEQLLSPQEFRDYCPNGIQVEGKGEVGRIAFAVSGSLAAIEAAARTGADALIVHHGLFWNKDPYPIVGSKKKKLEILLKEGISLLAYHLPLDGQQEIGNNWKAARELGWRDLEPFYENIGVAGRFAPVPVKEFQKKLENYYGHMAHAALGGKEMIASAALISGGAHRQILEAADRGVDCFVTGSFDEPVWDIAHERGIHFFALGHYATERIGILALLEKVRSELGVACEWLELPNPF